MATRPIVERIIEKINELHPFFDEWTYTYDEAAKWFDTEVINNFGESHPDIVFSPTEKYLSKKDYGIGLINQQISSDKFFMSDRCVNFKFEMNNCVKDEKGNIPKINDHLIDDARYTNHAAGYEPPEEERPEDLDDDDLPRAYDHDQDFEEDNQDNYFEEKIKNAIGDWF